MQLKDPLKNTLAAATAEVLSRVLGFLTTAYLARALGTASFGLMSIGLSVLSYAVFFSSPGLHLKGTRDVAAMNDDLRQLTDEVTSLRFFLACLGVVLLACGGLLIFGYSKELLLVVLFSLSSVPLALTLDWYFQGKSRIVPISASKVLMYCGYLVVVFGTVRSPDDILWAPVAFFAANLLAAVWLYVTYQRDVSALHIRWDLGRWRVLIKESLPLGVSSLLMQTIVNMPVLIVGAMLSASETGLFSASMKLLFFALMIDRVFNTLFFPVVSRYRQAHEEHFPHVATLGLKVMLAVSLPITAVGVGFGSTIVSVVYGPTYLNAAPLLQYMFPYFVFTTTNTVLMSILYSDKREKDVLQVLLVGTSVLVLACVGLSLAWRAEGAAAALSFGEGLIMIMLLKKVQGTLSLHIVEAVRPMLFSGAAMGILIALLHGLSFMIVVPIGLLTFVAAMFFSRGLTGEDIRFLKEKFV